jgi:arginine decarboxylase
MESQVIGNRIPNEYFITTGKGESGAGSAGLPFETGSYDAALNCAGIENVNVIKYTSVIPTDAKRITRDNGLKKIRWGEVMECIMAQANGTKNNKITAAVMTTEIKDPQGLHLGGFACEYSGSGTKKDVERSLLESINGMIERRGLGKFNKEPKLYQDNITQKGYIIHPGKVLVHSTMHVKKAHGTVLASICFVSYKYPLINKEIIPAVPHKKTRKHRKCK